MSPTLLVPINTEVVAERRMYLPLAALCALAVVGGYEAVRRRLPAIAGGAAGRALPRNVLTALGGAVALLLVTFGVASARRIAVYGDEVVLWEDTVRSQPADPLAHYNLGVALLSRDQPEAATRHFETAIGLDPDYPSALINLGVALGMLGRNDEAIVRLTEALRSTPDDADVHFNLGTALVETGRLSEGIGHYERARQLAPQAFKVYNRLAAAYARANDPAAAIAVTEQAIRLARSAGQNELAEQTEAWLARYRVGRASP